MHKIDIDLIIDVFSNPNIFTCMISPTKTGGPKILYPSLKRGFNPGMIRGSFARDCSHGMGFEENGETQFKAYCNKMEEMGCQYALYVGKDSPPIRDIGRKWIRGTRYKKVGGGSRFWREK
jgi:hypothetical protein